MKNILVLGSLNMDLVVEADEIPLVGETVLGKNLQQIPGGKGANQAVAMSNLGANVTFLGKIGNDIFANKVLNSISKSGVNVQHIETAKSSTGIAVINVDKEGKNNIVVIPGANWDVDLDYLERKQKVFANVDVAVFQLEIPLKTVKKAIKLAKAEGAVTILNPAPATRIDYETMENIDILIPNEHELARMSGIAIIDEKSLLKAATMLLSKGVKKIIVTLGSRGVLYVDSLGYKIYKPFAVNVVDTTAAGDSFVGGFTFSYSEDKNIERAINIGQATAALSIQKFGAQSSLPSKKDLEAFILKIRK